MKNLYPKKHVQELSFAVISQMLTLATSGFGLVAALAWNEVIKQFVEEFIKPYLGKGSGIISLFLYACVITILAVIVTVQLSTLKKKVEDTTS